ncbi:Alpha-N-acetylgalactosaminidase [Hypsibius exemplaris]|uniref:Alpha-galactosidase n=1 Tax=Hypsibius exemplaris TaxID=2072580 RepID=A0A1W0WML7_HYPEX|nr:Alpha-N-acetylgalactosaminidase [Hypsibius exemplaris]
MAGYKIIFLCTLLSAVGPFCDGLNNGLALTPPMGWLAWERFRCNVDCKNDPHNCIGEVLFLEMAEKMASGGFRDAGYEYIILDDCWMNMTRDSNGFLIADPERFPSGIPFLSDYIHSVGLKFGIYEDIGTKTCGGYPGIEGYEKQDMQTFADWGVDYVKLDGCYKDPNTFPQSYPQVGAYMNQTGRPMVYSCSWPAYISGGNNTVPWQDIADSCNLWRNYDDIQDSYASLTEIVAWFAQEQDLLIPVAGPGNWNDPDMLLVGDFGLSYDQQKTQMAIWSILAAPLIMSTDLRTLEPQYRRILLNRNVIAVNQDKLGIQGRQIITSKDKGVEVWTRPITPTAKSGNTIVYSYAVAIWNKRDDGTPYPFSNPISQYGLTSKSGYFLRDLYTNQDYGFFLPTDLLTVKVNPSGVIFFKATPVIADR